ncbi:MAG: ATP-dependent helicase [Holophagaceae bacterium]
MTLDVPHRLLDGLNEPQQRAVVTTRGPLLILAGAGSGKTTVITRRIAWLIESEGVSPGAILAMTFTNKAAQEMSERVQHLVSVPAYQLWVSTFHSFCTRVLRTEGELTPVGKNFVIFDPSDQKSLMKHVLSELGLSEKQYHPKRMLAEISHYKNQCLLPHEIESTASERSLATLRDVYALYQEGLKTHHACDFDDLLLLTERLFRDPVVQARYQEKFKYLMVDEYQDTNRAQYRLIQHLVGPDQNICVVGDEDQSIYGWRGADIRNILDFQKDFPRTTQIKLEQNYRSTQSILDAASLVIKNNQDRIGKDLWTNRGTGEKVTFKLAPDGRSEGHWIADQAQFELLRSSNARVAILYRANWQSRQIEEALRSKNIPYLLIGGVKFYERQEIKDLLSYLRLLYNPFDLVSFRRAINAPSRGVGPTTLKKIEATIPSGAPPMEGIRQALKTGGVKGKAAREVSRFADVIEQGTKERELRGLASLVQWMLQESGLTQALEKENTLESESRLRNLEEFLNAAADEESLGSTLEQFLDRITLVSDADSVDAASRLSLMTIHCAKGLEFSAVFLTGMEEDVFPNRNAKEDENGLEEERRLFYVAITRAQMKLYLTGARHRRVMGMNTLGLPSRFLRELPEDVLDQPIRWGLELYQSGEADPSNHLEEWSETEWASPRRGGSPRASSSRPSTSPRSSSTRPTQPKVSKEGWPLGTRVTSPRFGDGLITASTGKGEMLTYTIVFQSHGEKRIVAKYGALEKKGSS